MTIQTALRQGAELLEEAGVPVPRLTAEVLLSHALGCERAYLYGHSDAHLTDLVQLHFARYLHERLQGKPTQYITHRQEFYGREFLVTPAVLIPRPETEHVIEAALALAPPPRRVADVGCGSGNIAVTLSLELHAEVFATDVSPAALSVASENARKLGAQVAFVECDLASAFAADSLDLVASNPPYVPLGDAAGLQREIREHEPALALFAGESGLDIYERLVKDAERVLRPGGALVMELGFKTYDAVRAMLGPRWQDIRVADDLAGIPRVLAARLGGM